MSKTLWTAQTVCSLQICLKKKYMLGVLLYTNHINLYIVSLRAQNKNVCGNDNCFIKSNQIKSVMWLEKENCRKKV